MQRLHLFDDSGNRVRLLAVYKKSAITKRLTGLSNVVAYLWRHSQKRFGKWSPMDGPQATSPNTASLRTTIACSSPPTKISPCSSRSRARTTECRGDQILISFARLLVKIRAETWLLARRGASLVVGVFVMSQPKSVLVELRTILLLMTTAVP